MNNHPQMKLFSFPVVRQSSSGRRIDTLAGSPKRDSLCPMSYYSNAEVLHHSSLPSWELICGLTVDTLLRNRLSGLLDICISRDGQSSIRIAVAKESPILIRFVLDRHDREVLSVIPSPRDFPSRGILGSYQYTSQIARGIKGDLLQRNQHQRTPSPLHLDYPPWSDGCCRPDFRMEHSQLWTCTHMCRRLCSCGWNSRPWDLLGRCGGGLVVLR